ncbi:MAG: MotA/TolQ/ExbB proton channel family protein [Cytophagales bacterium]|nr:MotA/TolQ/ExbB proton channel family protein [Cytophagales bacterium]
MLTILQAAGWPIWPLVICSIVALTLIFERFMFLRSERIAPAKLFDEAIHIAHPNLPPSEVIQQMESSSILGSIFAAGFRALTAHPRPSPEELKTAIEVAGRQATQLLEKYLAALATIASVAPLLGLLGTVIGMIEIFGAQAPTSASSGTNPAMLAHGISVALYNTAFGLIVAIPSLIFWRYFKAKSDAIALLLEQSSERFYQHIKVYCRPE